MMEGWKDGDHHVLFFWETRNVWRRSWTPWFCWSWLGVGGGGWFGGSLGQYWGGSPEDRFTAHLSSKMPKQKPGKKCIWKSATSFNNTNCVLFLSGSKMFSSQNPFYFEICFARKNRSPDLWPDRSRGGLGCFCQKSRPGKLQKKKTRHFGKPKCEWWKQTGSQGSHMVSQFFFSIKKVWNLEKRGGFFSGLFPMNEVIETLRTFCDLEGQILCFWFGSWRVSQAPPNWRQKGTTNDRIWWPLTPLKSLKHD